MTLPTLTLTRATMTHGVRSFTNTVIISLNTLVAQEEATDIPPVALSIDEGQLDARFRVD